MDGYGGSERALRMKRCASGWPGGSGWFGMGAGERRELLQQQMVFGFVAGSDQTMQCGANQIRSITKRGFQVCSVSWISGKTTNSRWEEVGRW